MCTVTFQIEGQGELAVSTIAGENLLQLARDNDIAIDAPCGSNGSCGKCRIRLVSGQLQAEPSRHISHADYQAGWRLACTSTVVDDAVVWVPADAGSFQSGIQTADLSTAADRQRYSAAVEQVFTTGLQRGTQDNGYGVAIDIGTTTVTAALLDLASGELLAKASAGNGQIRYGADVINRIIASSRPGGREALRQAILTDTLLPMLADLLTQAALSSSAIRRCVIAGNTTMEHLLLGEDASSIRLEPYVPAFLEKTGVTAAEVGLPFSADTPVILAPNVGSYVGGDITAGILTSLIWNQDNLQLFLDLGTNGELVLGNRDFLLCCACSAGPAFEGGEISCGMRATAGAVQAVRLDQNTLQPTLDVIGSKAVAGVCGSGLIDLIAELFRCGAIDATGKFVREHPRIWRNEYTAAFVLAYADESQSGKDIQINETDIGNFIRAKAAIYSAIHVLLQSLDMDARMLDSVQIAGGIGGGINIANAIAIGMLPALSTERFSYIGNSALTGACAMLLSDDAAQKVLELGRSMTYVELSTHPGYMDEFIAACFLPHTHLELFNPKQQVTP
ncbi:MAG: ASKHA domain-containing protein [Actinomycetia bacterium]|nr:ASKHA domain-containing protein [Actinomycetes bacterium]